MSTDDHERLNRIDDKLDEQARILVQIKCELSALNAMPKCPYPGMCEDLAEQAKDREKRLRSLEIWRNILTGAWLVLSICGVLLWDYIKLKLKIQP